MAGRAPGTQARHRILVIDDEPATARVIRDWYKSRPFEVLDAPNGPAGIALARERRPDLIVLDLRMPGGPDGIEVANELRRDAATQAVPLIMLTAVRDVESRLAAFNAGADHFLNKPFLLEELDAIVRVSLRRRAQMRVLETSVQDLTVDKEHLEKMLVVDEKTGLFNFREFQRRLKEEWQRAERYATTLSLVFFDIDHFKRVNDTHGHQAGDQVLRDFAMLVRGGARANDIAARFGGEEFAVILPHTDGPMAVRVAERVRAAVREFVFLADATPLGITVSAGVATYPAAGTPVRSVEDLIRAADRALYRAKDAGRDRVVHDRNLDAGSAPA